MRKLYINKSTKEVLFVSAFPETDLIPQEDGSYVYEGISVDCITENTDGYNWGDIYNPPKFETELPTEDELKKATKKELFDLINKAHQEYLLNTFPDDITEDILSYCILNGIKPVGDIFIRRLKFQRNDGRTERFNDHYDSWVVNPVHLVPDEPIPPYGVWERISGIGYLRFSSGVYDGNYTGRGNQRFELNARTYGDDNTQNYEQLHIIDRTRVGHGVRGQKSNGQIHATCWDVKPHHRALIPTNQFVWEFWKRRV